MGGKKYPANYEHKIWGSKNEQIVEHTVGGGMVGEARGINWPRTERRERLSVRLSQVLSGCPGQVVNKSTLARLLKRLLHSYSPPNCIDLSQR